MIIVIGEILYDRFPAYKRIGGAPFNFAFHLKQLGFDVRFISRVGRDDLGDEILGFIHHHGFDTNDIQVDHHRPTGQVKISMETDGSHTFSILENMAYDGIEFDSHMAELCNVPPRAAYFGTLIQRTARGRETVRSLVNSLPPHTLKFCDINLRPGCWSRPVVDESVQATDILKLSDEELDILMPHEKRSARERAAALLGPPGPTRIIVTMGARGSFWLSPQGITRAPEPTPAIQITDTVGAGDAYGAMAAAALLSGLEDDKAIALSHEFAAGICTIKGALPQTKDFYTPFLPLLPGL